MEETAPIFAALGDPTRLEIILQLCNDGPLSISKLSDGRAMTRQAITKHLDALSEAGLVHDHRVGRERIWELSPKRLDKARRYLDRVSADWDKALGRLKDFVEREES